MNTSYLSEFQPKAVGRCLYCGATKFHCEDWERDKWAGGDITCLHIVEVSSEELIEFLDNED